MALAQITGPPKPLTMHPAPFPVRITLIILFVLFSGTAIAQPVINSFSPQAGPAGTTVTISGSNFSTTASSNIVYFGAVRATVTAATAGSLTVTAPTGATYQPMTVTVNGLTAYSLKPFLLTFSSGGNISANTFGDFIDFTTDLHPNGLAMADLDGDGKTDLATPNNYSISGQPASISVLRNTSGSGAISFAARQDISNGVLTYAMASADFDGDGKIDLAASSVVDKKVSIFRNTSTPGAISFAAKVDISCTDAPFNLSAGDLDGDGKPDIVVVNNTANSVSVYRNTGTPGTIAFAPVVNLGTALSPFHCAIGDADGDGKADLFVSNNFSNSVSIFRNTGTPGTIGFGAAVNINTGAATSPYGILLADLDGDGKLDASVAVYNSGTATTNGLVYKNASTPGALSFSLAAVLSGGLNEAYFMTAGDINGDGKPDVAFALANQNKTKLYQNYSTPGVFNLPEAGQASSFSPYATGLGDLDGDNRPDLINSFFTANLVQVLPNRSGLPGITSFQPAIAGTGTTVTITGNDFTGASSVSFGGVAASSFTVVNSTTITAVVGAGASGNVVVTTALGSGSKAGFIYAPAPTITGFTPASGGINATVTITGTNFLYATAVSFGGVPASSFTVNNATSISATVGAGASGAVVVTTPGGTATAPGFTYLVPTISSFTPSSGGNGTVVTINGTNLSGAYSITFGGVPAASYTVVNSSTITAVVGPGATGSIVVTTPLGTAVSPGFTYTAPIINSFTPTSAAPGATVTISGSNFTGTTTVLFGGTPASSFAVVNSNTIAAIVGNGTSGAVSVTTPLGNDTLSGFIYTGPPVITAISPASAGLGNLVTITGAHFSGATAVSFGGTAAQSFTVLSNTIITAVVGTGSSGNVTVTTGNGQGSLGGFTWLAQPKIGSFTPASGPVGTTVTIAGQNFSAVASANSVYFGSIKATVSAASPTSLTVTVPAGTGFDNISVRVNSLTAYSRQPFTITFPNNGLTAFGSHSFSTVNEFDPGGAVRTAAVADLDGDGKPEIGVVNLSVLGFSIFKNTSGPGNLTFDNPLHFANNFQQEIIAFEDLDGDGLRDVLVQGLTSTIVRRNTTTGGVISFGPPQDLQAGTAGFHLVTGDLDVDGKPDIICADYYGQAIGVLRNLSYPGTIIFAPVVRLVLTGRPNRVALADVDGDSKPEIVTSRTNFDSLVIFRNTSTPGILQLGQAAAYPAGNSAGAVAVADLDGDGKPDAVAASYLNADATIYRNNSTLGSINMLAANFAANVGSPTWVSMGDMNGDGKPDMCIVGGPTLSLYNNTSTTGSITFDSKYSLIAGQPANAVIADMDGDGRVDLVTQSNSGIFKVAVFRNTVGDYGITAFTPASAGTGTTVTITGVNFTGATAVKFGGVAASSFAVVNATTITAVVGNGASGAIEVTVPQGIASKAGFTYLPSPAITSFTPASGQTGTGITITGTNFNGATAVSFGGVPASSFIVISATTISAVVGAGASGNVSVTNAQGSGSLAGFTFLVPAPTITSFTPTTAAAGAVVTITGINLLGTTAISFGGTPATSFIIIDATTVTAVVGSGTSGSIAITTPGGTASLAGFTFNPVTSTGGPVINNASSLVAFPNPTMGQVLIRHPASPQPMRIRIVDMLGREVATALPGRNSKQTNMDLSALSGGLYQIIWTDGRLTLTRSLGIR